MKGNNLLKTFYLDLRQYPIIARYKKVAEQCREDIERHLQEGNGRIEPVRLKAKKALATDKVIWQYWGQGVEDRSALPEVVQYCFESVDKYKGEYQVIRLSDETIAEYLDLPDFIYDKLANNPEFTRTFFSDFLRLALLSTYGGVWLDATILLTAPLPKAYTEQDFFAFQRSSEVSKEEQVYWRSSYYAYWGWQKDFKVRLLTSVLSAKVSSPLIQAVFRLIYDYWEREEHLSDYFLFLIYFQELVEHKYKNDNCPIVSDTLPHILHTNISSGGAYQFMSEGDLLGECSLHKMSYFEGEALERFKMLCRQQSISIEK